MVVETGKITPKQNSGAEVGNNFEKRGRSCDAKNFVKIRLSKHPKIEDVRCQFWRDFWTGEGQGPQFWHGRIAFSGAVTTCVYDCRVRAESVVNQTSCLSTEKTSEQVECPLVLGQGGEHDSKGVCCHPNVFILSIVM